MTACNKEAGANYDITQPIQERFNDLIAGTRSDLAIKVYGDDLRSMLGVANKIALLTGQVRGAADVRLAAAFGHFRPFGNVGFQVTHFG